jgi:16S rRNA processing protein RimM
VQTSEPVVLGRIGAPFGIKGWVHVQSFSRDPDSLLDYEIWQLSIRGVWKQYKVLQAKGHGKGLVALLSSCSNRDEAALLTNTEIGIDRSLLPELPEGEHYWSDLIGLEVITENGEVLGHIDSLFETGSNDVVVVKNETREHLLPYIPEEYILEIDLKKRQMKVRWDPEF